MAVSKKKNPVPSESIFVSQGSKRHHERTIRRRDGRVGMEPFAGRRQDTIPTPLPKKADVYLRIERKNAELRATYLQTTELYTPEDIQGPSTKWKREGRVLRFTTVKKICSRLSSLLTGNLCRLSKKSWRYCPTI